MAFGHIARWGDTPDVDPTTWTLLSRADVGRWHRRFYGGEKEPLCRPVNV